MSLIKLNTYKRNRYKKRAYKKYKTNNFIEFVFLGVFILVWGYETKAIKPILLFYIGIALLGTILIKLYSFLRKQWNYRHLSQDQIDILQGKDFEKYLKANFQEQGYRVKLTPDTNDYGADLILTKGSEKIIVQAKRYKGKVGNHAIQEVIGAMHYYNGTKALVVTNSFFTPNAIKMAQKCNVELWDRDTLKQEFKI